MLCTPNEHEQILMYKKSDFSNMTVCKSAKQLEKSQFGTFSTKIGTCVMAMKNQVTKMGGLFSKVSRSVHHCLTDHFRDVTKMIG
jgi:hypothetical protein